jgi:allantoinase
MMNTFESAEPCPYTLNIGLNSKLCKCYFKKLSKGLLIVTSAYLRGQDLIDSIQTTPYSRDLVGYQGQPPHAQWPNQARIAVQFVLNYEEGGENHVEHGDQGSEQFLSEIVGAATFPDKHMSMDSMYEYGSRAGFWRIHEEFKKRHLPMTIFGVGMALARHPAVVDAIKSAGYDVVSHGQRWLHYQNIDIETERQHMDQAISVLETLFGESPIGWYTGRDSPNTRQLLTEFPQIKYDCDYYGDDLPFWKKLTNSEGEEKHHLIIPYTLDTNDMKFSSPGGFNHAEQFYLYLKDAFDVLYAEGEHSPKMMSVGMHCRLLGRPGRFKALQKFLDYVQSHDKVWICRRGDIAQHWMNNFAP